MRAGTSWVVVGLLMAACSGEAELGSVDEAQADGAEATATGAHDPNAPAFQDPAGSNAPPRGHTALPPVRGGAELLGAAFSPAFQRWIGEPVAFDAAPLTLVRWWTDTCPFCEASLPAIQGLRDRYAERGLATVAVYHPKPKRNEPDSAIRAAAQERGYRGPLAVDPDWSALDANWPDALRSATSVSFLVDHAGRVRWAHPGPIYHPARHAGEATARAVEDFTDLTAAIEALLPKNEGE